MTGSGEKRWQVGQSGSRARHRRSVAAGLAAEPLDGGRGRDRWPARSRPAAAQRRRSAGASTARGGHAEAGRQLPARCDRWRLQGHDGRAEHRHQARPGPPGHCVRDAAGVRRQLPAADRPVSRRASTADNPTQYTIKIRKGIDFQNGKPFTADDVIYSLQRIGTQGNGLTGFAATATMDIKNIKKIDKLHGPAAAAQPRLDGPADPGQLHVRHGPGRLRGLQGRPVDPDRHWCLQAEELHPGPAERAASATRTTGVATVPRGSTR